MSVSFKACVAEMWYTSALSENQLPFPGNPGSITSVLGYLVSRPNPCKYFLRKRPMYMMSSEYSFPTWCHRWASQIQLLEQYRFYLYLQLSHMLPTDAFDSLAAIIILAVCKVPSFPFSGSMKAGWALILVNTSAGLGKFALTSACLPGMQLYTTDVLQKMHSNCSFSRRYPTLN